MRLIFFFSKYSKFNVHSTNAIKKIENKVSVSEMYALEPVTITSPDSNEITGNQQPMC